MFSRVCRVSVNWYIEAGKRKVEFLMRTDPLGDREATDIVNTKPEFCVELAMTKQKSRTLTVTIYVILNDEYLCLGSGNTAKLQKIWTCNDRSGRWKHCRANGKETSTYCVKGITGTLLLLKDIRDTVLRDLQAEWEEPPNNSECNWKWANWPCSIYN